MDDDDYTGHGVYLLLKYHNFADEKRVNHKAEYWFVQRRVLLG